MTQPRTTDQRTRPILVGCAVIGAALILATIVGAALWMIPNARVSTMPVAPVTPVTTTAPTPPPPPALLVHVKPSAPEIATLLSEALGSQAIMITPMLPYEGTFTVDPNEEDTAAAAEFRLSVPRSAAALHVLLRAQIDQPTPSGYVVRDVERLDTGVLHVHMDGPLAPPVPPLAVEAPVLEPLPLTPEAVALVTVHNETGAWTRVANGYLQNLSEVDTQPAQSSVTQLVSANLRGTFSSVDELLWELHITCTTPAAAQTLKADLDAVLTEVQAQDALGLHYTLTLQTEQSTVKGKLRITGIRNAAQTIAKAYQEAET